MIRIESIEIEEFRGIRKLKIELGRRNFGICGPNGTGKSGVVDAIEFALTGDITRLGGAGSAELSVKAHAAHVDTRQNPDKSSVKIVAFAPAINKTFTIKRTVRSATEPDIEPVIPRTEEIVAQLATHPEFALSRREIVKYIITPAGQRSKDVQALLRLDQIEKVRQSLQRVANDARKDAQSAATEHDRAKRDLIRHLGIGTPSVSEMLTAINERRKILQLAPIDELKADTSVKQGVLISEEMSKKRPQKLNKATTLSEIASFCEHLAATQNVELTRRRTDALKVLRDLQGDPEALRTFRRQVLVRQGLELVDEDSCPLCDKPWNMAELQSHLQKKLSRANEAAVLLGKLEDDIQPFVNNLEDIGRAAAKVIATCALVEPKVDFKPISDFSDKMERYRSTIAGVSSDLSMLNAAIEVLEAKDWGSGPVLSTVEMVRSYVASLPDPSKEDEAREFIIVAQERYDRCRLTNSEKDAAVNRGELSENVVQAYGSTSNRVLEEIYNDVQKDFTEYYRIINEDDEDKFEGMLTPSPAKLAFDVDFYGRGKFPPGAYHSEGHQDGMGLCLYLALMKRTLGEDFTFAVLDDVLMSVDAGHRRQVCTLLKTRFPKTQFILTTHDPIWLQFMRTENLI